MAGISDKPTRDHLLQRIQRLRAKETMAGLDVAGFDLHGIDFASVARSLNFAVILIDNTGQIIFANEHAVSLLQYRRDELLQLPSEALFPGPGTYRSALGDTVSINPEFSASLLRKMTEVYEKNAFYDYRTWVMTAARQLVPVDISTLLLHDPTRQLLGSLMLLQPVTQRCQREHDLAEQRRRLDQAQQLARMGDWELDLHNGALAWSDQLYRLLGYAPGETPPSLELFLSHVHPDDRGWLTALNTFDTPAEQLTQQIECRLLPRTGGQLIITGQAELQYDAAGQPVRMQGTVQDITERKQFEQELLRREERLNRAQQVAAVGSWEYDPRDARAYWSDTLYAILGLDQATTTPSFETILRLLHPDDQKRVQDAREAYEGNGSITEMECRIIRPDGAVRSLSFHVKFETSDNGATDRMVGTIQDITDRKQTEKSLQAANKYLDNVFTTIADCLVVTDGIGNVIRANAAVADLLGYERDEITEMHVSELTAWKGGYYDPPSFVIQLMEEGLVRNAEVLWRSKDGTAIPVEINASVLYDAQGDMVGAVCSARDIRERKQALEERLRLHAAIEQCTETVMLMAPDGTIQYVNPAMEQLTGLSASQVVGHNPFFDDQQRPRGDLHRTILTTLQSGRPWQGRMPQRQANGTPFTVQASISPVRNDQGDVISFVSIGRDITRELDAQQQLRQSQQLESLGTLAGGIAHDFNNILAAIIGYAELMQTDTAAGTHNGQRLEHILNASYRARDLVRQILSFSRQQDHQRDPVHASALCRETIAMLRASLPATIAIDLRTAGDPLVLGDRTQLQQVLINVCVNAAQAMAGGGTLRIALDTWQDADSVPTPLGWVRLCINDTGPGIPEEIIERIFDPFFTTKAPGEGTGMGLAVAHGIVSAHGGRIRVDSTAGAGTTVTVLLPAAPRDLRAEPTAPQPAPVTGQEHILFVDDEQMLAQLAESQLSRLGYTVTVCRNGTTALSVLQAKSRDIDLLITDQSMPGMTGVELIRQARAVRPDLPAILCTGFSSPDQLTAYRKQNIQACLLKPVAISSLAAAIRTALRPATS